MPARRMTAVVAFAPAMSPRAMTTLIGRRIATPPVPPSPGSTPMTTPTVTPITRNAQVTGRRAERDDRRRPERVPRGSDVTRCRAGRGIEDPSGVEHGDGGDQDDRRRRSYLVGPHARVTGPT